MRKGNFTGQILCRNYLLKHIIEGKREGEVEVTGGQRRKREKLMDDFEETRRYWKLRE
jgi:hypothetical protein